MKLFIAFVLAVAVIPMAAMAADDGWLRRVPAKAHLRSDPLGQDAEAAAGGEKLYRQSCASCHGANAQGRGSRPSLRSARVQGATDGDLEWLVTNGDLGHGMPSWSRLPEAERWQIVRYLRTLPSE